VKSLVCILFSALTLCFVFAQQVPAQPNASPDSEPLWLVREGVFRGKIFLPEKPAPEERDAAGTLARWILKVTGAKAEIVPEDANTFAPGVYIGATRHAAKRKISAPPSPGETWHWAPAGHGALFILGNSPLATRLAVGEFLQIHLGVTFLLPGEWGAEWAALRVVSMPAAAHTNEPGYKWRFLSGAGDSPESLAWMRNNGLGAFPLFTHALHGVFDAETAKTRPDFFPFVRGEHLLPSGLGPWEPQPNLAAPGAATHAASRAAAFFRKETSAPMFSLGINDSLLWDESAATTAFLTPGSYFRGIPDYSNYVFVFMNRVATALWPHPATGKGQPAWDTDRWTDGQASWGKGNAGSFGREQKAPSTLGERALPVQPPGKFLGCLAYAGCERPPDFPLHPNIFPVLATDRSQWRDPVFRSHDSRLLRRWARSGVRHFGIYDYYYGRDFVFPRVFFDEEIDSIRWGAENGAALFYAELYPDWGFDAPKAWLATRLLLYPSQNSALLLKHFFNEAYGPAADPMREFFDTASRCWDGAGPARWLKFRKSEGIGDLVSEAQQTAMHDALQRAADAFPGAALPGSRNFAVPTPTLNDHANERLARQQIRVRMTALAFAATERFLVWHRLRARLQSARPDTPAAARRMLAALTTETRLRREFETARELWEHSEVNPGATATAGTTAGAGVSTRHHPFPGGIGFTMIERLLRESASRANGPSGGEWNAVFNEVALFAMRRGGTALVHAAANPGKGAVLLRESFDAPSFPEPEHRPPTAIGEATRLRAPWRTVLSDCETLRFGFVPDQKSAARTGSADEARQGFLRIGGADEAALLRDVPGVAPGTWIAVRVFVRGSISPGARAGLTLRFLDAAGKRLPQAHVSVLLYADSSEWSPVVALGRAPAGAVAARVILECHEQEAGESLDWDNLTVTAYTEK
jgi:hypothetical protein